MVQVNRTVRSNEECKVVAQYLTAKHKGAGGFGVLHKAQGTGDTIYLQNWFEAYGNSQIWKQAQGWLRKWRLQKTGNRETSISIRQSTLIRLQAARKQTGNSYDQLINSMLDEAGY